jgi:hypothetical protein
MAKGIKSTPLKAEIGDIYIADEDVKVYSDTALSTEIFTKKSGDKIGVVAKFVPVGSGVTEGYVIIDNEDDTYYISDTASVKIKANPDYDYPPAIAPQAPQAPSGGANVWDSIGKLLQVGLSFLAGKSTTANADTNGDGTVDDDEKKAFNGNTPPAEEKTAIQKAIPYIGGGIVLGIIVYFVFRVKKPKPLPQGIAQSNTPVPNGTPVRQTI